MKNKSIASIFFLSAVLTLSGCKESVEQENAKEFKTEQGGQVLFDPMRKEEQKK